MNPNDVDSAEDRFVSLLAAYDEALAHGLPARGLPPAPVELEARLCKTQTCLDRLEREWPRAGRTGPPTDLPADYAGQGLAFDAATGTGQLGRFRLLRELGRGGSAIVFLAFDPVLRREVALKLPRPESLLTPGLRERFLREARSAAGFDHPNLVPVYEAGEVGPFCYIISAFCRGPTLGTWLKQQNGPVPPRTAAALVVNLAGAVQYMHARGVVHRDIKPGNILLAPVPDAGPRTPGPDTKPGTLDFGPWIPKISDFGLAKLLDDPGKQTTTGTVMGTAGYMAPEQAEGRTDAVGPPADVYALGVILYEVLTGQPPFRGQTELDTLRQVKEAEPVSPRRLRPDLARDLETICLKCLRKEADRRYATAEELGTDLRRFLAGKEINARPMGWWERAARWLRRRLTLALLVVACLAVLAMGGKLLWNSRQPRPFRPDARPTADGRARGDLQRYARHVQSAAQVWERDGRPGVMLDVLRKELPTDGAQDQRGFAWHYLWQLGHATPLRPREAAPVAAVPDEATCAVACSRDGKTVAAGTDSGRIQLVETGTGRLRRTIRAHRYPILSVAFSPDGRWLCAGGGLKTEPGELTVWDVVTGERVAALEARQGPINGVDFSPDGKLLASAASATNSDPGGGRVWDTITWRERSVLKFAPPFAPSCVRFSPVGRFVALGRSDGMVQLWNPETGEVRDSTTWLPDPVLCLAYAPDGKALVSGSRDGAITCWDVAGGRAPGLTWQTGFRGQVWAVAFAPDGRTVVAAGDGGRFLVCARGCECPCLRGAHHTGPVRSLAFTPDGKVLVSSNQDSRVEFWTWDPSALPVFAPAGHDAEAWAVAFAPDGALASAGDDDLAKLWDLGTDRPERVLRGHDALVSCLAFAPEGMVLATGGFDRQIKLWDRATGRELATLRGHQQDVRCLAFAPDGRTIASAAGTFHADKPGELILWDVAAGRERARLSGHAGIVRAVAFAPDGASLASAGEDGTVRLWDVATGRLLRTLKDSCEVWCLAFSPDGLQLASGNAEGRLKLWDPATGRETDWLEGHGAGVRCVAFSPGGTTLASGGDDRAVRLWHAPTRTGLLTLRGPSGKINSVAFSADGRMLACAGHDGSVVVWRGGPGRAESAGRAAE